MGTLHCSNFIIMAESTRMQLDGIETRLAYVWGHILQIESSLPRGVDFATEVQRMSEQTRPVSDSGFDNLAEEVAALRADLDGISPSAGPSVTDIQNDVAALEAAVITLEASVLSNSASASSAVIAAASAEANAASAVSAANVAQSDAAAAFTAASSAESGVVAISASVASASSNAATALAQSTANASGVTQAIADAAAAQASADGADAAAATAHAEALAATASAANALTNYATASGEISNLNLDVAGLQAGVGLLESTLQMTHLGSDRLDAMQASLDALAAAVAIEASYRTNVATFSISFPDPSPTQWESGSGDLAHMANNIGIVDWGYSPFAHEGVYNGNHLTYMGAGPVMWEVKAQVTFDDPTRQYQSWSQNHCSVRLMRFNSSDSTTVQMAVAESFEGEVTHLTVSHYIQMQPNDRLQVSLQSNLQPWTVSGTVIVSQHETG